MSNTGKSIFTFQDTQERKIFNSLVSSSFVFYIFSRAMKIKKKYSRIVDFFYNL